jgi:hypothetical protein
MSDCVWPSGRQDSASAKPVRKAPNWLRSFNHPGGATLSSPINAPVGPTLLIQTGFVFSPDPHCASPFRKIATSVTTRRGLQTAEARPKATKLASFFQPPRWGDTQLAHQRAGRADAPHPNWLRFFTRPSLRKSIPKNRHIRHHDVVAFRPPKPVRKAPNWLRSFNHPGGATLSSPINAPVGPTLLIQTGFVFSPDPHCASPFRKIATSVTTRRGLQTAEARPKPIRPQNATPSNPAHPTPNGFVYSTSPAPMPPKTATSVTSPKHIASPTPPWKVL